MPARWQTCSAPTSRASGASRHGLQDQRLDLRLLVAGEDQLAADRALLADQRQPGRERVVGLGVDAAQLAVLCSELGQRAVPLRRRTVEQHVLGEQIPALL